MKARGAAVAAVVAFATAPAVAETLAIDLPAGTLGQQVVALGRAARISVAVPDPQLWGRRVPALRGRWDVAAVLQAIAHRAHARLERIGPGSWRLIPHSARAAAHRSTARAATGSSPSAAAAGADVLVVASKRDTSRENFPGQFARVEGADLALGGAGGTDRLVERLTSVASTHLGSGRNKLFIRGIADSSFTGPTQATVGQYFGDLRLSYNAPDPDLRLSDLAAVEVLAGPQGTLYGAGSLGGLIRLVPNGPDMEGFGLTVAAGGSGTAHGRPGADAHLVANVPLVRDRIAIRLVADAVTEGGYIDKPLLGRKDVNRTRVEGGRATLRLALGPGWRVEAVGIGQRIRAADSQYADRDGPPLTRSAPVTEGFEADFGQAQLILAGSIGGVRVRSTTGTTAHDLMERYDATQPGQPVRLLTQANRTRMQANETRVWRSEPDGSGWLAGFSYIRNRTRLTRQHGGPGELVPATGVTNGVDETTLYGEGGVRLLPGLLVTGGLRLTRSALGGRAEDVGVETSPALAAATARRIQETALPAAAALVDLTPGIQLFMRYQQGFRPGGLAIEGQSVRRFRADRVATIEAGVRSGRPGVDRLDAALTLARSSWSDIQADFIDATGLPSTANVGDGTLWSAEGAIGWGVGDDLRLEGAFSLNDGRIDAPSAARAIQFAQTSGPERDATYAEILAAFRRIPNIANVTGRVGAAYQRNLGAGRDLRVDGWVRYVGSSRLGIGPVLGQRQGAYMDSGVTARLALRAVGVTLGVTNFLDVRGNRFALGTPFTTGRDQVTPLRPRTIRIGIDSSL